MFERNTIIESTMTFFFVVCAPKGGVFSRDHELVHYMDKRKMKYIVAPNNEVSPTIISTK